MRQVLENLTEGHQFYHARRPEFASDDALPFRISPEPLYISDEELRTIAQIGTDVCGLMAATGELYQTDEEVHELLDRGKPDIFKDAPDPGYIFYRPDLIITPDGFSVCEIETSVFGLALAELLNKGYSGVGFDTVVEPNALEDSIHQNLPAKGVILYSDKTKGFVGQLRYLADKVFSGSEGDWGVEHVYEFDGLGNTYRAHYLAEYVTDSALKSFYDSTAMSEQSTPSATPQFEEKAIMALLWDKRFTSYFRNALGDASFDFLQTVIPPTWILGEEAHFAPGLPSGVVDSVDLASLSKSHRGFVLKSSGFSSDSSWSEGVTFLNTKSRKVAQDVLQSATEDTPNHLYVVQEFTEGSKHAMQFQTQDGLEQMSARVRVTPYIASETGEMIGIKATGCEGTHLIHGTSSAINTAVAIR